MAQVVAPVELENIVAHPALTSLMEQLQAERAAVRTEAMMVRASLLKQRQAAAKSTTSAGDDIWAATSNRLRKKGLWDLYLQSAVLGSIVDAIAKRFISGQWSIVPLKDVPGITATRATGTPVEQMALVDFFLHCNEDQDFKQILYGAIRDLVLFGETYLEVVPLAGVPQELYPCSTMCMDYVADQYGGIDHYTYADPDGQVTPKIIAKDWLVRAWIPGKDPLKAFSLVEGMVNPLYSDNMMVRSQHATFQNMGSMAPIVTTLKEGSDRKAAEAYLNFNEEMYTGVLNSGRERVVYGGATVTALAVKGIDSDFLQGREHAQLEAMGRAHIPSDVLSRESPGHLGGAGVSESHERSFVQNVLNFYGFFLFEKLNYRIVNSMFGISGWQLGMEYADAIGDPDAKDVVSLDEKRARQGLPPSQGPNGAYSLLEIKNRAIVTTPASAAEPDGDEESDDDATATPPNPAGTAGKKSGGATDKQPADGDAKSGDGGSGKGAGKARTEAQRVVVSGGPPLGGVERVRQAYHTWATAHPKTGE